MLNPLCVNFCDVFWDPNSLEKLYYQSVAFSGSCCHSTTRLGELDAASWLSFNQPFVV
jgi:hypothetical protein